MKMPLENSVSLSRLLRRADPLGIGACSGANGTIHYRDILGGSSFANSPDFAGCNILLVVPDQLSAALALIQLDGVARRIVLCPPDLESRHFAEIADVAEIDTVVYRNRSDDIDALGLRLVEARATVDTSRPFATSAHRTEWVLLTSGTSGRPKLVLHDLASLTGAIRPSGLTPGDAVWSTFYDIRRYGGLQIFLRAILGGHSMVLSQAGEPLQETLKRLGAAGVSHISGTPSHWRRVLMSGAADQMAPKYVRLSGEIADQAVLDALQTAYPQAAVSHAYASTEAGVGFNVIDGREGFPAALIDAPSVDGEVAMKVVDGSLHVRSRRTAMRYLGHHDAAIVGDEGFVDTSDLVELRGNRYYFVGRRGGMINVGGAKVYPEEIEAVINAHPLVHMSLVRARRNPITGALVIADVMLKQITPDEAVGDEIIADILARCADALPPHKVPTKFRIVPHLDVSESGKLRRSDA